MGLENRISAEPSDDIESASDDSEGVPAHAAYEQLGHQSSCDEEAEVHHKSDVAYHSLAPDSNPAQAGYTAAHDSILSNGHAHLPSAPLDCQSAQVHASACDATPQQRIDAGTLVATARALNAGCQPIRFAQWASTSTSDVVEGSSSRGPSSTAPSHDRHEQNGSSSRQEKAKQRPKVTITQQGEEPAKSLDLTEEKRTAIQGAMKNISLDYMPQWAAAVPEQAWIKALKEDKG